MIWSWGYSPKIEKYVPLDGFPADKYLVIALHSIKNLGWHLSHLSETGIIAYTGLSWQSYSEEISIRTISNFAVIKSECVGIQLLFNDYGKNAENLDKFFNEFEYVEFHLKDSWEEELILYHTEAALQDDEYFERAPLASKAKIDNLFHLFNPRKGYLVTPLLVQLNILYFVITSSVLFFAVFDRPTTGIPETFNSIYHHLGVNNRHLTLSGDYWRLITYQFIHFSLGHIFFNMYALVYIGLMVENKTGSLRFLITYILSGIVGGTISLLFHPLGNMGGASGAIMGMFGCFLALLITNEFEKNARKALIMSTGLVVLLMLTSGLQEGVDNAAHVGGLMSGFLITWIFQWSSQKFSPAANWIYAPSIALPLISTAIILTTAPNYQLEKFSELNYSYKRNERQAVRIYYYDYYYHDRNKADKLNRITKYGIANWHKNIAISKQMQSLILPAREKRTAERMLKFAQTLLKINQLLYYESAEETQKYRPEILRLTNEMNSIRESERTEADPGWRRIFN